MIYVIIDLMFIIKYNIHPFFLFFQVYNSSCFSDRLLVYLLLCLVIMKRQIEFYSAVAKIARQVFFSGEVNRRTQRETKNSLPFITHTRSVA